jgi:hypothetical protein
MARSKHKQRLRTRWDEKKLDAYADYIGRARTNMHAAVLLYEVRQDMRDLRAASRHRAAGHHAAGVWSGVHHEDAEHQVHDQLPGPEHGKCAHEAESG